MRTNCRHNWAEGPTDRYIYCTLCGKLQDDDDRRHLLEVDPIRRALEGRDMTTGLPKKKATPPPVPTDDIKPWEER